MSTIKTFLEKNLDEGFNIITRMLQSKAANTFSLQEATVNRMTHPVKANHFWNSLIS